jgi:hypothetical protein
MSEHNPISRRDAIGKIGASLAVVAASSSFAGQGNKKQ